MSRESRAEFSERAFRNIVWPEISEMCGGGALKSVERSRSHEGLDTKGGVDAYQEFTTGVRFIAQRTERLADYGKRIAFTIRFQLESGEATEWQKRIEAIDNGYALPGLTIHSFVRDEGQSLIRCGIAYTAYLYKWVRKNLDTISQRTNDEDGTVFLLVPWSDLVLRRSRVPFATKDSIVQTRYPKDFQWPSDRWI